MEHVVIVGASASGLAVIETLRRRGFHGKLTVVGDEPHYPYDRPPLSKQFLRGHWETDRLMLSTPSALERLDASWLRASRAVGLDVTNHQLELSTGLDIAWDRIVIATGVSPRRLASGDRLSGVHVLRTLEDAIALRASLQRATRMVIVGGGFLGTEVASVAQELGVSVTVVEPLAGLAIRQLGKEVAGFLADLHIEHGVTLKFGTGVLGIEGARDRVAAVSLTDGSCTPADVVLVAIGSIPNTAWLNRSGLSISDGVDCDDSGFAGSGVYAVGDVANWWYPALNRRYRIEHRMNAIDQGRAVATLITGHSSGRPAVPYFWTDQFNVRVQVYGIPSQTSQFRILVGDPKASQFAGGYFDRGNRLSAGPFLEHARICKHPSRTCGQCDLCQHTLKAPLQEETCRRRIAQRPMFGIGAWDRCHSITLFLDR